MMCCVKIIIYVLLRFAASRCLFSIYLIMMYIYWVIDYSTTALQKHIKGWQISIVTQVFSMPLSRLEHMGAKFSRCNVDDQGHRHNDTGRSISLHHQSTRNNARWEADYKLVLLMETSKLEFRPR